MSRASMAVRMGGARPRLVAGDAGGDTAVGAGRREGRSPGRGARPSRQSVRQDAAHPWGVERRALRRPLRRFPKRAARHGLERDHASRRALPSATVLGRRRASLGRRYPRLGRDCRLQPPLTWSKWPDSSRPRRQFHGAGPNLAEVAPKVVEHTSSLVEHTDVRPSQNYFGRKGPNLAEATPKSVEARLDEADTCQTLVETA